MKNAEVQKSKPLFMNEEVDYVSGSIVTKTVMKKLTGDICAIAFDSGKVLTGKISPFDKLVQVIDGSAEVVIDNKSNFLKVRESIIIPAHASNSFKANSRFKIISTVIKSGYED